MVKAVKVKRKNSNGKYTQEEVKQIIDTRWGKGKYILMSTYKNKRTKLHLYCTKHDLYFDKYLYQLQRNGTCPKCNKENFTEKRRVSQEEVEKRIGDDFELVTSLKAEREMVTIRHKKCGHTFERRGSYVLGNQLKCPYCEKVHKLTSKEYTYKFNKVLKGKYELLSEYTGSSNRVLVKHLKCGNTYDAEAGKFLSDGGYCAYCSGQVKTKDDVINQINSLSNNEYELISNYKNNYSKVELRHKKCGNIWKVRMVDFVRGSRCPYCGSSNGEKLIKTYLEENHIPFEQQKKFPTCKYYKELPFDFYIDNKVLVEYQGQQHYEYTSYFYPKYSDYEKARLRDRIKYDWATNNNITLLRIPYNHEGSIEEYLDKELVPLLK